MKLTSVFVKHFEQEQKKFGTKIALHNVIWQVAADIFKSIGITKIHTSEKRPK